MGLSSSKTKTTSNSTSNQTATTAPNLPQNLQTGITGLVDKVNELQGMNPYNTVAGPSPLQDQAYLNAANLGGWQDALGRAGEMAGQAAGAAPAFASAYSYQAPQIASNALAAPQAAQVASLGPAAQATTQGYQAPQIGQAATYQAQLAGTPEIADATGYAAQGYKATSASSGNAAAQQGAASLGSASLGTAATANAQQSAAQFGQAALMNAPRLGAAGQASGQGYDASLADKVTLGNVSGYTPAQMQAAQAEHVSVDPIERVQAASLLDNFQNYLNPATGQLVDATLASYDDQAGRTRAAQAAQAARNGAFAGSRYGIESAQLSADSDRNRALTEAQLRTTAFDKASALSQADAGFRQQAATSNAEAANSRSALDAQLRSSNAISNAQMRQQASQANAGWQNDASQFLANAGLQRILAQGNLDAQIGLGNAGFTNSARQFNSQLGADLSKFNTEQANNFKVQQGNWDFGAAQTNANNLTQTSNANAQLGTQNAISNAQLGTQAAIANASNLTSMSNSNADRLTSMSNSNAERQTQTSNNNAQLGTQASIANAQNSTQANIANAGYANDAAWRSADAANQAASQLATARNNRNISQGQIAAQIGSDNARFANDAAQFGARAFNDNATSNANYQAQALANYYGDLNRASLANSGYANDFARSQFDATNAAARQYASDSNSASLAEYQGRNQQAVEQARLQAQALSEGTSALNANSQFNANQYDDALARYMQGAQLIGDLGNNYAANQRGDIGLQAQLGDQQRQIQQQYLNAPTDYLAKLGALYGVGNPMIGQTVNTSGSESGTQVQKSTPSLFNQALAAASVAASFAGKSDRRAKREIERVGTLASGLGLYRYLYLWDEDSREKRIGVMADEVARIAPEALGGIEDGYRTVDYGRLGLAGLMEA